MCYDMRCVEIIVKLSIKNYSFYLFDGSLGRIKGKMYPDSEILFPPRCIQQLRDLRGPKWQELIECIIILPNNHEEILAFGLMMIKLGSCLTCDLDSYRASLGCCTCARRTISGFKGDDTSLLELYHKALDDVKVYVNKPQPLSVSWLIEEEQASPPLRRF